MSGCIEHMATVWDAIKKSRKARSNVRVVWLDLANEYGAVPHLLIWKTLKVFHINQSMRKCSSTTLEALKCTS